MKIRFLCIFTALLLVCGCGVLTAPPGISADEEISDEYAYVTGRDDLFGQWIYFRLAGDTEKPDEIKLMNSKDYPIYKVRPGTYDSIAVAQGGDRYSGYSGSFTAEAGKITYIGDIRVLMYQTSSSQFGTQVTKTAVGNLQVKNNSDAVKEIIRNNHPKLVDRLDTIFIYRPMR